MLCFFFFFFNVKPSWILKAGRGDPLEHLDAWHPVFWSFLKAKEKKILDNLGGMLKVGTWVLLDSVLFMGCFFFRPLPCLSRCGQVSLIAWNLQSASDLL